MTIRRESLRWVQWRSKRVEIYGMSSHGGPTYHDSEPRGGRHNLLQLEAGLPQRHAPLKNTFHPRILHLTQIFSRRRFWPPLQPCYFQAARISMPEPQEHKRCRADVNRANAAHSTGPRSAEGKNNSKRNSFKHGAYAKDLVLPGEDPAELDRLRARLRAEHQPGNETESILVNEIAEQFWRLRRMREMEVRALQPEKFDRYLNAGLFPLIARQMASAERGMYKAIATLRQLQQDRGFVPSTSANPDEEADPSEESQACDHFSEEPLDSFTWLSGPQVGFVPPFLKSHSNQDQENGSSVPLEHDQGA